MFLFDFTFILIAIFLPFRQADLTAPALLQGIRGEGPQQCHHERSDAVISLFYIPFEIAALLCSRPQ